MTPFQAAILALVQAVTEFLPISSSGHLILLPRLLGWSDQGLEFDIATNTGTLVAVMLYFRAELADMVSGVAASLRSPSGAAASLRSPRGAAASLSREGRSSNPDAKLLLLLALGTIPAAIAGLLVKDWVSGYGRDPRLIAVTAIGYGALLIAADRFGSKRRGEEDFGAREAFLIGCAQALALVPGTSRSGVTMTAALVLGFSRPAAARFSFLLAIPIGLLVAANQAKDIVQGVPLGVSASSITIGIAVAAVAGYGVIAFLLRWIRTRPLAPFGWYRIALGSALLLFFR